MSEVRVGAADGIMVAPGGAKVLVSEVDGIIVAPGGAKVLVSEADGIMVALGCFFYPSDDFENRSLSFPGWSESGTRGWRPFYDR